MIKKYNIATKIQNGGQNSRWRQINIFLHKNRLQRHLSGKFPTIFGCKTLSIDPKNIFGLLKFEAEIQDGVKIQNGVQKRKNLIFAAK